MDSTFADVCQGLGLALAAGCLFGSVGRTGMLRYAAGLVAVIAGVALAPLAGEPVWLGIVIGIAASLLAYAVASDIAAGATRRAGEGTGGTVGALLAAVAVVIAVVSVFAPPAALVALAAIAALAIARRRRAGRKYAGLRVLR